MYREHAGGSAATFAKVGSRSDPTSQRWLDGPPVRTVPADKSRNPPHVRRPGAAESGREATRPASAGWAVRFRGPPRRVLVFLLLVVFWNYPALAQVELSGMWQTTPRNQDGSGMTGDTAGVPVSQAGRWRADSWSPEDFDVAEWVCRPHSFDYGLEGGLSRMRVWSEVDPPTQRVIAWHAHANQEEQETTIWMDGRPHPPENTLHTWSGFSTGAWEGDVLVVTTTHVKEAYIRRTGLMRSDQTTVRSRWRRIGNYLQLTTILYDPVYLAEPYIRSSMMYVYDPAMRMDPYPCEEATETAVPRGAVPHFLPGRSPLPGLNPKLTDRFRTPYEPRLGGPETMYPEYIAKIKTFPVPATVGRESD